MFSAINSATARLIAVLPLVLAAQIFTAAPPAYAGRFEFDQRRTEVQFVYKMAYSTQRGRFTKVSGTVDYDQAAPARHAIGQRRMSDKNEESENNHEDEKVRLEGRTRRRLSLSLSADRCGNQGAE